MQGDLKFSGAEADLIIHATEDREKIVKSLQDSLEIPSERFVITPSEGHYKNRILTLNAVLSSAEANGLASRIASNLNSSDRQELTHAIEEFSDEKGNLYLRLDKQRLCQGKVSLSFSDSIRLKFKPVKRYRPTSNLDNYRGLFSSE